MIKFRWIGINKHFKELEIHSDLTTEKVLTGSYLSFFSESNRSGYGNCLFLSEDLFSGFKDFHGNDIYEGDIISIGKYSYVVVFEKGTFYLNHIKNDLGRWGLLSRCYEYDMKDLVTDLKVTDNIYKEPLKKWRKKIKEKVDKH